MATRRRSSGRLLLALVCMTGWAVIPACQAIVGIEDRVESPADGDDARSHELPVGTDSTAPSGQDATTFDAPGSDDGAAATDADGGPLDGDAGDATDARACQWLTVTTCNAGKYIAEYCTDGSVAARLRRCDTVVIDTPGGYATMYKVSKCPGLNGCAVSGSEVVFSEIECCEP